MFQIALIKFLLLQKLNKLSRRHMFLVILKVKRFLQHFTKKNCQKTNQKEFSVEKVIKRKGSKVYVKCKGYDNSFNSCIDKKDLV